MTDQQLVTNPFGKASTLQENALTASEENRYEAEVQSAMVIAKRFPRDQIAAVDRILQACTRNSLAEAALYAYPRGDQLVTGPSIRLAEALAQNWGNMQFGIRELSATRGVSTVEAFAWDIETNTRQVKAFQVPHERHTKRGSYQLSDPRDIYELVANQGARRLRACILGVIPGDVVEAAVKQCELTQQTEGGAPEEQVKKLLAAFESINVSREQIEAFIGHRLDSVVAAEVVRLRKIYTSIKDGMSSVADFFERGKKKEDARESKLNSIVQPGSNQTENKPKPATRGRSKKEDNPANEIPPLEDLLSILQDATDIETVDEAEELGSHLKDADDREIVRGLAAKRRRELKTK